MVQYGAKYVNPHLGYGAESGMNTAPLCGKTNGEVMNMVYPASIYSLLMSNHEAAHFFDNLSAEQQQKVVDTEFKSSQEFYDHITSLHAKPLE